LEEGNTQEASHYFLKALQLAEKHNVQWIRFKANFNLYQLAKREGDAKKALDYLENYFLQKESVINNETYSIIKSYDSISKIESLEREAQSQKEKNEIIEKKNAELDSFFYRISHDLKGPVSSLLGLNAVVNMEISDEPSLRLFAMYHSQVMRMNDIVMGLINLTEINNTEKLRTRIDFEKLVDECVDSCRYLEQFSKMKVEKDIQPIEFHSEWAIINTILQNLIENGIKYSRTNTQPFLKIKIYTEQPQIVLSVEDNGQGIPESHQSSIFNMFYRANQRAKGSGLGLYILKRAVERLNGTIAFTSIINTGSTFVVKLPIG
jgi:signal transduction histidine kinase